MWTKAKFESTQRCVEVMNLVKVGQKLNLSVPDKFFILIFLMIIVIMIILLLFIILFVSVQADFQRQDVTYLLRKATQKKQFAAAII